MFAPHPVRAFTLTTEAHLLGCSVSRFVRRARAVVYRVLSLRSVTVSCLLRCPVVWRVLRFGRRVACFALSFVALCCVASCCVVLCCVMSHCAALRCVALRCVASRCIVLCCVVLWCVVLCCVALRRAVSRRVVLRCVVLFCVVLCCVALCRVVLCCRRVPEDRTKAFIGGPPETAY